MGIVVCVAMALGLIAFMPMPWRESDSRTAEGESSLSKLRSATPLVLAACGAWNTLWYGLLNLDSFWGKAGLITGLIMMLSAVVLTTNTRRNQFIASAYKILNPLRIPLFVGLLASFLIYLVTLIQLNLGLPIIS